mmetsp:Transcript_3990/g.12578  ORF Transcript_3990/g.12578 Transcript_3990/m.12578 type:complete len:133 (-) Transcript_3990:115-513(-)
MSEQLAHMSEQLAQHKRSEEDHLMDRADSVANRRDFARHIAQRAAEAHVVNQRLEKARKLDSDQAMMEQHDELEEEEEAKGEDAAHEPPESKSPSRRASARQNLRVLHREYMNQRRQAQQFAFDFAMSESSE